ncbi:MAG TPA: hypothetical protein VFF95_16695 [Candidatus Binatus sp.]|nr:hypothetical protein [Candidatus Binatus sp.]
MKRYREERSYPARESLDVIWNDDNRKARTLLGRLTGSYALNESRLRNQLDHLVETYWLSIDMLACALLGKDWEPIKPLMSDDKWSDETMAKCVSGKEAASILAEQGIAAICGAEG